MPLGKGVRFRTKQTSKGPVRLAFKGAKVIEARNMKTGATHGPAEFAQERRRRGTRALKAGAKF